MNDGARSTREEAFAAGLVAQRAAGLEPSDFAKELAARVVAGEITGRDMEAALLEHHGQPGPFDEGPS
jgi:hypothetical protein